MSVVMLKGPHKGFEIGLSNDGGEKGRHITAPPILLRIKLGQFNFILRGLQKDFMNAV